jgi:hypothetical protein
LIPERGGYFGASVLHKDNDKDITVCEPYYGVFSDDRETWPGRCFTYKNDGFGYSWRQLDWYEEHRGKYATAMIGLTGLNKNKDYQVYSLPKKK